MRENGGDVELIILAVVGSFLGGLLVFVTGTLADRFRRHRARRLEILGNMTRAGAILATALREGVLEPAKSTWAFRAMYDRLTMETLLLFNRGEESVAMWTAIEFHSGYKAAVYRASTSDPTDFMGFELEEPSQALPRPGELFLVGERKGQARSEIRNTR